MKLILASASKRRNSILQECGVEFEILVSGVEECDENVGCPKEIAQKNARLKAEEIAKRNPDAIVIGADTVVIIDSKILTKPSDLNEARNMLSKNII